MLCGIIIDDKLCEKKEERFDEDSRYAMLQEMAQPAIHRVETPVRGINEGLVLYSSSIPFHRAKHSIDNTLQLTRLKWLHWNMMTDESKEYVPEWMKNKIRCNM